MGHRPLLTIVVSCLLAACVANEPQAPTRGTVVSGPPPAPMTEPVAQSAPPAPGATWVTGYWHWTGAQYTWVPGHWETPPRGARWTEPRYSSHEGQYFYEAGRWEHTGAQPQVTQAPANGVPNANGATPYSAGAAKALR